MRPQLNPFLYGKPVPPKRFVGRRREVRTLFSRISSSESTAIVGEPHIGKSSLKRYVCDQAVRDEWLGDRAGHSIFVDFDCHLLPREYSFDEFWRYVLDQTRERLGPGPLEGRFDSACTGDLDAFRLQKLFDDLGREGWQTVVLMDEFDTLLHHPQLNSAEFFGPLRTIANNTDGLAFVSASRLTVSELNRRTHTGGSPFFNNFTEIKLPGLRPEEVDELLDLTLEGTGQKLAVEDRSFIRRVAGRHPYLVQAAAAALFDSILDGCEGGDRYTTAARILQNRTEAHFEDSWHHLDPRSQVAMVILALAETDGQVHQRDFDAGSLGQLEGYEPELRGLERRGLVEGEERSKWHVDWGNFALWRGHRWRVSAGSFVWWIADNAIAGTRDNVDFESWLREREVQGLLTRGEMEKLKALADKIPKDVLKGASSWAGTFLKGFLGTPT